MEMFDKDKLYKRTGWFSKECDWMIKILQEHGLCIVDLEEFLNHTKRMEDDLK